MKIAILLVYYNRPLWVQNAFKSILESHEYHQNWRLLIGDDGSPIPIEPIAREFFSEHLDKVDFINTNMSLEEKINNGISIGKFANEYMLSLDADIVITLCDDDILVPTYTRDLCSFFESNPECMYCYSDLMLYNPLFKKSLGSKVCSYNQPKSENPTGELDASQISFRLDCIKSHGCRFPETTSIGNMPYAGNVDAGLYQQLYEKFGKPYKTGIIGQYKGIHDYQLVWHKKQGPIGLNDHIEKMKALAGKVF